MGFTHKISLRTLLSLSFLPTQTWNLPHPGKCSKCFSLIIYYLMKEQYIRSLMVQSPVKSSNSILTHTTQPIRSLYLAILSTVQYSTMRSKQYMRLYIFPTTNPSMYLMSSTTADPSITLSKHHPFSIPSLCTRAPDFAICLCIL